MTKLATFGTVAALLVSTGFAGAQTYRSGNDGWSNGRHEQREERPRYNVNRQYRDPYARNFRGGYPPQECVLDEGGGRFRPCSMGPN